MDIAAGNPFDLDELSRHRRLSQLVAAALTLAVLATALSLTMEALTHPGSLVQLLVMAFLLVLAQAGALGALLLGPLALRVIGAVVAVGALLLLEKVGPGGFWILAVATAVALGAREAVARWQRLASALLVMFAAAAVAMWGNSIATAGLVRAPMVLACLLALLAGLLLLLNFLAGRDAWGSAIVVSGVSLGIGGLIGLMGSTLDAARAGEDSLSLILFGIGMLGVSRLDMILALVTAPVIVLVGLVRMLRGPEGIARGHAPASARVQALALVLAGLTVVPALPGLLNADLGAVTGLVVGAVYSIVWVMCLVAWYRAHRGVIAHRLPLTALSPDHALVLGTIVLSPLVRGVLSWIGIIIEGGPIFANL
ncbi:hypothetical protein BF93_03710 [Brachybacterium phenoliresistens]|uniref:Uncharacterized protein n=1 Tax=Brachybacterium phenoliresistens TaxID=396014 RepID=Z9JR58_9MICO|nr:hypothetical protein [Brachybacterium phenoliresistens]EWS80498.1 hypothetical protein BF93_03710 [Brachybacterium phenoliresistens]